MKLPRKVDYACRVLARLALTENRPAQVERLAEEEGISANYLVQILNELRTAGLVDSRRGRGGGYRLARPAREISLRHIIDASEGAFIEAPTAAESTPLMRNLWLEVVARIDAELEKHTLDQWSRALAGDDWMI